MRMNFRKRNLPPGPRAWHPFQHLRSMRDDLLGFFHRLHRDYGDVVFYRTAGRPYAIVTDPTLIERILITDAERFTKSRVLRLSKPVLGEGLLTSEGDTHKRQRRMMQPAFYPRRMNDYAAVISECAGAWRGRWSGGQTLDVGEEMMALTLVIAGRTLFGADVQDEVERIGRALAVTRGMFRRAALPLALWINRLPLRSNRRYFDAIAELDEVVYELIERARRGDGAAQRADLMPILLRARDEAGDGRGMSDRQVRDEVLTLLLAGHETTAQALTWTWFLLSGHPEVEAKLHAEVDGVLGDVPATINELDRLPYTRRVLAESMRLRPPAYTVGRTACEDYPTGRHTLPAGTQVLMPQHVVHRDPRWYAEPEAFRPDRWAEDDSSLPRFAYFPFGGGPRTCIGERFAWTEAAIVLATFARRWRLRLEPGHPIEPEPMITLRPKHGMRMSVEARDYGAPEPEHAASRVAKRS